MSEFKLTVFRYLRKINYNDLNKMLLVFHCIFSILIQSLSILLSCQELFDQLSFIPVLP